MMIDQDNTPLWVLRNRAKANLIKNDIVPTKPPVEAWVELLDIWSPNLQLKLKENNIYTLEDLKNALEGGIIFASPKHKQIVKNFIEKKEEEARKAKLEEVLSKKQENQSE